jgi:hypothetical protein
MLNICQIRNLTDDLDLKVDKVIGKNLSTNDFTDIYKEKITGVFGSKSTSIDAGDLCDISVDNDYLYICVQTGTAGNAIWKKCILMET